jgi:O-6-methylguanine DNA methyltransferase
VRWLEGRDDDFGDVALPRGTEFQQACWRACRTIPRGEVRTYAWVARAAGRPGAARAVGQAMRRNPMPIAVPCHRVVGAGTRLGGYAGAEDGASERVKRTLQATERRAPRLRCPVPQERNAR